MITSSLFYLYTLYENLKLGLVTWDIDTQCWLKFIGMVRHNASFVTHIHACKFITEISCGKTL
jgi:hypothetical protein